MGSESGVFIFMEEWRQTCLSTTQGPQSRKNSILFYFDENK